MGRVAGEAPRTDIPISDEAAAANVGAHSRELGDADPSRDTRAAEQAAAAVLDKHGLDPDGGGDLSAGDESGDIGRAPAGRHQDDLDFDGDTLEPTNGEPEGAAPARPGARRRPEDNAPADPDAVEAPPELLTIGEAMGWDAQEVAEHIASVGLERAQRDFDRYSRSLAAIPGQQGGQPGAGPSGAIPGQTPAGAGVPPVPSGQAPVQAPGFTPLQPYTEAELKRAREDFGDPYVDQVLIPTREHMLQQQRVLMSYAQERAVAEERTAHAVFDRLAERGATKYGRTARINPQSAEFQERRAVYAVAERIIGTARQGGRPISLEQAIVQAHVALNPQQVRAEETRRLQAQITSRHRQTSIPPGVPAGGRRRAASPEQQAAAAIVEVHRRHNLTVPQE